MHSRSTTQKLLRGASRWLLLHIMLHPLNLAIVRLAKVSLQLETLTEFAEYHLKDDFEKAEMLAEACLHLPNFGIIL